MNAQVKIRGTIDVRVAAVERLGEVLSFDLVPLTGVLPLWDAGAHVDLFLRDGLIRQYSLCGDPDDRSCYRLAVLRDPASRGGSQAVHDLVRVGEIMKIGEPRNLFPLDKKAAHSVLIGGGIGVTPLIAMAYTLHAQGQSFTLHYLARDPVFTPFLQQAPFAQAVVVHDRARADVPRFDPAAVLASNLKPTTRVYTCGPLGLMDAVFEAGLTTGYTKKQLHREAFSAQSVAEGDEFEVLAAKSGVRVQVGPDETVAGALGKAGVKVTLSCEQGICGTCVVSVLEGEPEHRDEYLTEDERTDQITLCCSRSRSPLLVVDI